MTLAPARSGRATISAWMRVHADGGRACVVLELLRPYVDELVVGVDERAPSATLAACAGAADRVVRLPYVSPVERANAYMFGLCGGDWILRLDGDEVPSLGLLRELRERVRDAPVTRYVLPRAWLWPDATQRIDQRPVWPDHQPRLLVNDPRLLLLPGDTHTCEDAIGPARYLEHPLYHLDLLGPLEGRRRKAERYERLRPGLHIHGVSMNELYYLPEDQDPPPRTAPVADEDAALIARVLRAREQPTSVRPLVATAPLEELDARWSGRPWPPEAYRAGLALAERDLRFVEGEGRELLLSVENRGSEHWPAGSDPRPELRLSYRWRTPGGAPVPTDRLRTPLPSRQAPGERQLVPAAIVPPAAGDYVLELDLVVEHVRWFGAALHVPVRVAEPRAAALSVASSGASTDGRSP